VKKIIHFVFSIFVLNAMSLEMWCAVGRMQQDNLLGSLEWVAVGMGTFVVWVIVGRWLMKEGYAK
jgi:hypothetical protein